MIDDDDPKSPAPAPEGAPAGDQAADEQKELPLEGDEPEGDEAADDEPTDEEGDESDDEQDDEDEDGDDEGVPKRKSSRVLRYKREAEAAKARLEEMRSRVSSTNIPQDDQAAQRAFELRVWQETGDPPDPNDPKYQNNYVRFERETQAWENDRRAVVREVRKEFLNHVQQQNSHMAELVSEHKARIARLRTRVKDFDVIMARATVPVHPHVEKLILKSKRSDRISLHLAKDQNKLVRLNRMSPEDAAQEIGIIEGRIIAAAKPKGKATQARKPVTPLRGGGASPTSGLAAVNAYIKKQYGDR